MKVKKTKNGFPKGIFVFIVDTYFIQLYLTEASVLCVPLIKFSIFNCMALGTAYQ
jgi:hypothetical protein